MKQNLLFNQASALGKRLAMVLTMLLTIGIGTMWGESIEINTSNSGVDGSYRNYEFDVSSITFGCNQWMKNNNIQAKKSTTNSLYNVDAIPGIITSIVVKQTGTARAIQIYGGTSTQPTTQITSPTTAAEMTFDFIGQDYTYFSLTTPGNACYFDKITINYTPSGGGGDNGECTWELVTDVSTLKDGDKVVIAAKDYNYAISTTQNGNNRGQASVTKNTSNNTITFGDDVQILTLEEGNTSGTLAFYTGKGYLYAASSGSNYMRTETTLSANSSWTIEIATDDGTATIVAQGANTRNTMQYNQSSSIFSCYGSASQKAIVIYKEVCTGGSTETLVYLHPNFGSESATQITTGAPTYTVPICSFTRDGYTFSHWDTKADDSGIDYNPDDNIDLDGTDVNLYAQWTCKTPVFDIKIKGDNPVVFSGESIELTVVGSNIAADATYQWYKKNGESYNELAGETTNKLTIAEATANDAGNYKCVVTNGTCSGENNYTVKMYRLRGLKDDTWNIDYVFEKTNDNKGAYSLELNGATTYEFKIHDGSAYYGNTGDDPTMTSGNCTNWEMEENMGKNVELQTTITGTYTFTLDYQDKESRPLISVTYPSKQTIYFKPATSGTWADNAKFTIYSWGSGDPSYTPLQDKDCGGIYSAEISTAHTSLLFIKADNYVTDFNSITAQTIDLTAPTGDKVLYDMTLKTHLYLDPGVWNVDNAWFAAYFFGNGETWKKMTDVDGLFACEIPTNYPNVIFVRKNPSNQELNFNDKWAQTGDLTIPTDGKNKFSISGWDNNGSWSAIDDNIHDNSKWTTYTPNHTVTFDANGHGTAPKDQCITDGGKVTQPTPAPTATGYTFDGWYKEAGCTNAWDFANGVVTEDITLHAKWTANTNTAYTVKHYQENIDGTYPATPTETENLTGTTATSVTPAVKDYTGFKAPSTQTVAIAADGSTLVEYRYTRNSYTLTWNLAGGKITEVGTTAGSVKFGAPLTAPTVTKSGLTFNGWDPVVPATMPAEGVTYTAIWKNCRWVETTTIEDGDEIVFIMVDNTTSTSYAMNNRVTPSSNPLAIEINTDIFSSGIVPNNIIWDIQKDANGIVFYSKTAADNYLRCNAKPDVRVGVGANNTFTLDKGYIQSLSNDDSYLAVATGATTKDWRQYGYSSNNITNQTLKFYKRVCLPEGQYWVKWMVNGQEYTEGTPTISVEDGNAITHLPTPPSAPSGCSEKVFVGWTDSEISEETDIKPTTLFTDAASAPAIDGDKTFYAVFADEEGGNFSLGQSGDFKIYANVNSTSYYAKEDADVDKIPSTTDSNEATIYTFTKETIDGKEYYSICNGSKYIGYSGNSTSLKETAEAEKQYWSIEKGTHGSWRVTSKNASTRALAYRASTYNTFRAYSTSGINGTEYYDIEIGGGTIYSAYTTLCDANKATITYDLNGGTGATCAKTTVTKGEEFALCNLTPTKTGYDFAGWTDGINTYAAGATVTVDESTTFYAKWNAKTITITWDQNYTDCPEAAISTYIYDGEEIAMPAEPIRTGYKFTGWFTAATDGTQVTEVGETNKPTADVTYYAHWAELYTVTFMASGQVYVVQEHKYLSGETLELPADPSAANYACDGYIFEGWSADEKTIEDATKPELISNPTITNDETYYAVWKKATTEGAGETIFYESFDDTDGTGGNDDKWSGDIATSEAYVDNDGWDGENVSGAKQCIKLGTGSKKGSVTTPALSQLGGNATLSFKAAAWNGSSESTTLVLSIKGGGSLSKTSVTLTKGAWQSYEVTITGGTSSTRITFEGKNTSNSRFFLDDVKVTTSGSYNYTTSPSCGPTIVAKDGMWVTSANSQSVKVNVPIAIKSFTNNATITGTTANSNFAVTTLENTGNGEHNLVVTYTPNASDIKEDATITLTAKDGEETISTTTFTLNGRSLPDEFAIVVDKASEYFALPANMPSAGTYPGYSVTLNAGSVTSAPKTHLYTAQAVHNTRFAENGTALRLVGNNNACLWATNAVSGTDIRNYAQLDNAKTADYEWNLYTEDGDTYRISCTAVTEEGRILRMYGQKFGMYKSGSDGFRLLSVECTSTPLNVSASAARTSATISWTNAEVCDVEVYNGSTKVQTISAATSPVVVSGLAESTAYTFTLTPTDNTSCVSSGAFTTTGPTIDIVEWETDGIVIQVDKDDELNPKVVIKGEEEHGDVGGHVATELFFSKYFEAHAENKLLAIFNGTTATIDLTGYTIKSENGTLDLSQFGQTKGKVASNEEIILVYYDAKYSAEECAEIQKGYENWNILTEKSVLAFSGRGSLGLYKNDVLIDVIGSTFPSGELTKIGKSESPDNCGTDETVRLHIDGVSVNDQSSFFCFNGDNIKTDNVETDYALSTNRCLLIRKNTVTSGANAVATNKADEGATCGDLSSTFATLCSEWSGYRIGSGKSSTDEIKNATCDGLGYVGGFDYNNYYRTLETIGDSEDLEDYTRNADENTYFITIDNLAQYSCLNIQLQLTDVNGNVLTEQTSQVPILVTGEKSTTDEIFSAIVKDSETSDPDYENSKIRCSTCDVVILKDATLTKADADTENDINQVRDIYVYPGGRLIVPTAATDFSVNNISMRRVQDDVATANVETPLLITSSSNAPIYVDVRINAENWHWFTLPYDCNIADVTWVDGSKPKYNADWFLMYYDGESRAASTNPHDNHWKVYEGTKIEAGKGYIVGITGHASKPAVKFELRFPMAQEVLTAEQTGKTVAVNAWGVKSDNTPNNLGWNLVGNPYLNYYQPETEGFSGLSLLKYTGIDPVTGDRLYDNSGKVPFLVTPIDGGWYEYQQDLASDVQMMPFTAYFVQVGDPDNPDHTDGKELNASFDASNRGKKSILRRAQSEVDEQEEPAIVAISLTNAKGESDKTTLLIADRFTNEYEMNADFFKWFGDYYKYYTKPVLYTIGADQGKRAFNALNEELAAQPVALGMFAAQAGDYTFSLTRKRCYLSRVEEVWLYDATTATYTNLMQQDYTFTTAKTEGEGRFYLSVKMKQKTPTAVENVNGNLSLVANQQTLVLSGLPAEAQVWVYDATGKLLHSEHTTAYQRIYPVQQAGVYFVSVKGQGDAQTLSTIVK